MQTTPTPVAGWGENLAQRLLDTSICPVCGRGQLASGCCELCGADLRGPVGHEVWRASHAAATAVRARDALLTQVPRMVGAPTPAAPAETMPDAPPITDAFPLTTATPVTAAAPAASTVTAASTALAPSVSHPRTPRGDGATLQSVLAIAGAGLFAIAAVIFTFLNPDLSDRALRSVVVGLVTLVFLGGSWFLARRGLQFSAEAVGGLGLVFVGLDVYAFAQLGASDSASWLRAALATTVAGAAVIAGGLLTRIRVWIGGALLGIAIVPAMIGYGIGGGLAAALGHVGTAFVAAGLLEIVPRLATRLRAGEPMTCRRSLETERRMLVALQLLVVVSAIPIVVLGSFDSVRMTDYLLSISAVLALVAVHGTIASRHLLRHWWSYAAGLAGATAVTVAVSAVHSGAVSSAWLAATIPTTAALAFALTSIVPIPRRVSRGALTGGALSVAGVVSFFPLTFAAMTGAGTVIALLDDMRDSTMDGTLLDMRDGTSAQSSGYFIDPQSWPILLGLAGIAAGLALFGRLARRRGSLRHLVTVTDVAALLVSSVFVLTLACLPLLVLEARLAIVLGAASAATVGLRRLAPLRHARQGIRVALLLGIHVAVMTGAIVSWSDPTLAPLVGVAVIAVLSLVAATVTSGVRFLHVGAGFAYALVCLGHALGLTALGDIAVLCLVTSAGLIVAIVTTFLPAVGARSWYAVLAVTAVPFAAGIVQVVFERSGWTALSTGMMFALALSLLLTRRAGLNIVLRTIAAAMLVPTIAVVVVCLGAQFLDVSGSPVTLPIIAAIVAVVLPSTTLIRDALRRNARGADAAAAARVAIEGSALLTGAISTVLALARDAAGLGTTFLVLVILGTGAAASGAFTRRRYAWWVAGAAFTGALWCVWAIAAVDLLEAYLLPPAIGAALVAAILTARGIPARGLYAVGLSIAVLPSLALLALVEPDARTATELPWRAFALLAAAVVLLGIGTMLRRLRRVRSLSDTTLIVAMIAAVSGPMLGARMGLDADLVLLRGPGLLLSCLAVSALAAAVMVLAARSIRSASTLDSRIRTSRWMFTPAAGALAAGTWGAIERDWFSIWAMWALMVVLLVVMVAAAVRAHRTTLPPVWFLFALAFITAVVAWSPRDLRVEWFSLPLGAFLLLAGIAGMREGRKAHAEAGADAVERRSVSSWPARWQGSWALLAPGIVTMMSASIVATFTDPLTWRAILVMILALAAILVGASRRLAAPFLLGIIVLPIENVFAFAVQIGRGIDSMPWWITLAVVGAVLLIIAVTYERRTGDAVSVAARIRDLR